MGAGSDKAIEGGLPGGFCHRGLGCVVEDDGRNIMVGREGEEEASRSFNCSALPSNKTLTNLKNLRTSVESTAYWSQYVLLPMNMYPLAENSYFSVYHVSATIFHVTTCSPMV